MAETSTGLMTLRSALDEGALTPVQDLVADPDLGPSVAEAELEPGVGVEKLDPLAGPIEGILGQFGAGAAVVLELEIVKTAAANEETEAGLRDHPL